MSIYSGGEKYYRLAEGVDAKAYHLEEEISHMQTNRQLLSEIRKARLAAAQQEFAVDQTSGEYISNTGQTAATANIYSTFAGAYGYSMDLSNLSAELQTADMYSSMLKKKGAKADKRAATATQITMAVLAVAGGAIGAMAAGAAAGGLSATAGAGIGVAAGGAVGAGGIRAIGGGKVARKVANKAAINYAITGATMAAAGGAFGNIGGTGTATTGDSVSMAGGISKSSATIGGTTTVTGPITAAPASAASAAASNVATASTSWLSTAKQIGDIASTANTIKSMATPDYSYVEDKYKKTLYRQRYNRIYA